MKFIPATNQQDWEYRLSKLALESIDAEALYGPDHQVGDISDLVIYGGTRFTPGANYDQVLEAFAKGNLLGMMGVSFDEDSVHRYAGLPDIRMAYGRVLALTCDHGARYVPDALSRDWGLHYSLEVEVGGHPAWICPPQALPMGPVGETPLCSVEDVGFAIACALWQVPCVLYVPPLTFPYNKPRGEHPLARFAERHGLMSWLAFTEEKRDELLQRRHPAGEPWMEPARVETAQQQAWSTLRRLVDRRQRKGDMDVDAILAEALGGDTGGGGGGGAEDATSRPQKQQRPLCGCVYSYTVDQAPSSGVAVQQQSKPHKTYQPTGMRELVLGDVFDPATHYSPEYFAGRTIFTRPDGTKDIYSGPGRAWDGFKFVSDALMRLTQGQGQACLDLGCSTGDFVKHARTAGFDAYGVDISEAATAEADPSIKPYLVCGDAKRSTFDRQFHLVTAWDFWEHIWRTDVDQLMEDVADLVVPGGYHVAVICTRTGVEQDWIMEPGVRFTKDNSWLLASGHVAIMRWSAWAKLFTQHGFQVAWDVSYKFQVLLQEDPAMARTLSWSPRHFIALRRVG